MPGSPFAHAKAMAEHKFTTPRSSGCGTSISFSMNAISKSGYHRSSCRPARWRWSSPELAS
jgi:hypothetical protein